MWFRPYVSVAKRQDLAAKHAAKLAKKGIILSPVKIEGRTIAQSFWGKGWCDHLESFSDFENRLPRGRTYARNGSVIDLQIRPGVVEATVYGSELYKIRIDFRRLDASRWAAIKRACAGQIGSVVELLSGKLSQSVMQVLTDRDAGMFPQPGEIGMDCSCPDWATMCKHVAAVLYGVGSRLDHHPELLFTLRQVDQRELVEAAGRHVGAMATGQNSTTAIAADDLSDVFGVEIDATAAPAAPPLPPVQVKPHPKSSRVSPKPAPKLRAPTTTSSPKVSANTKASAKAKPSRTITQAKAGAGARTKAPATRRKAST